MIIMEKEPVEGDEKKSEFVDVDVNITGISKMTRSGWIYTLEIRVTNESFPRPAKETTISS